MNLIYSYMWENALVDGILVGITQQAHRHGYHSRVAVTKALWRLLNTIPKDSQSNLDSRLKDLLFTGLQAMIRAGEGVSIVRYSFSIHLEEGNTDESLEVLMVALPADFGNPVIIMLPHEH